MIDVIKVYFKIILRHIVGFAEHFIMSNLFLVKLRKMLGKIMLKIVNSLNITFYIGKIHINGFANLRRCQICKKSNC